MNSLIKSMQGFRFFDDVYVAALNKCEPVVDLGEALASLRHGTAVLDSHTNCDLYIALYGAHHFYKLYAALDAINFDINGQAIEIVDWGCGQALATCVVMDYFIARSITPDIHSITLVEPSGVALERGADFVRQMAQGYLGSLGEIRSVGKYLDDLAVEDLGGDGETIKLHLFSNIIDVDTFDLHLLYELIVASFQGFNHFICTSPSNHRGRLDRFCHPFFWSYQASNDIRCQEAIYGDMFFFKAGRFQECRISRYERQFAVSLGR
jgi:hypothetical protein